MHMQHKYSTDGTHQTFHTVQLILSYYN